jgi:unsaturated rhamnogalacturonyl hydrolase
MDIQSCRKGFLLLGVLLVLGGVSAQHLPSKDTLMKQMLTANQYFMNKWPDPGADIVTDRVRPSNLWTRAVYYEGLMALYAVHPEETFFQYAVDWGNSHNWKPTYELDYTRDADHQCCGQTYVELYQLRPDSANWIGPITQCIHAIVEDAVANDWSWIDAIQMAMPLYAKLGVVHNDTSYFRKMNDLYMFTRNRHGDNGLYNTQDHLWYRDGDFDPPYTTPNNKSCYWSRGNGWVFAALVRVLNVIPDTLEYRDDYLTTFQDMAAALVAVQRDDGFWNASLFDPEDHGGRETSGTALFTYGLAWGINNGVLDSATYMQPLVKAWNGMAYEALHMNGFLGYVQSTGKQPSDGYPFEYDKAPNFEDYGLGAFLLAGSETYKLAPDTGSMTAFNYPADTSEAVYSQDYSGVNRVDLYPNPVKDRMQLLFDSQTAGELDIIILNAYGEMTEVRKEFADAGQHIFNFGTGTLPGGMYLTRVRFGNYDRTFKFFKPM